MKSFYDKYQRNIYSQNGEDGIIEECLKRLPRMIIEQKYGDVNGIAYEFGGADGRYCSNIANLVHNHNWFTYFIEADEGLSLSSSQYYMNREEGKRSLCLPGFVTAENVNELVFYSTLLSIDIDGNDYNVWKAYKGKPDIVVIEINSSIRPILDEPVSDKFRGTGYRPMVQLGIEKGYFLLCHTGNLIFIRNEHRHLFPEVIGDGLENWEDYFQTKWLQQ